ncbi:MAG: hypothetical protein PHR22_01880 [Candidatus Omnitrophica bacterium]|nr:hypothetical protein [Candidatus Omnitrophota bacterium]
MSALIPSAREWCKGRSWLVRLPVVLFFIYIFLRYSGNASYQSVFDGVNYGVHEFGHVLFSPFGQAMNIAGGSAFEILAPVIVMLGFLKQGDYFAVSFAFGWLSTALFHIAVYVADARSLQLELVAPWGFGEEDIIHDWNYLLSHFNMLQYDGTLALALRCAAVLSMLVCITGGSWLLFQMMRRE